VLWRIFSKSVIGSLFIGSQASPVKKNREYRGKRTPCQSAGAREIRRLGPPARCLFRGFPFAKLNRSHAGFALERLGQPGVLTPTIATTAPNGNVVSIPNDPLVDVDGDGLADTLEDPDLDGLVDAAETDPDNDNTDGDDTPDGAELRTGTDPLDPENDFVGEWVSEAAGGFIATWPSAPGAFYDIQTSSNLTEWVEDSIATDIPASDPGTTTSHTVPASGDPQRFYRIGLLP